MTLRIDTAEWYSGKLVVGGTVHGVLGSVILATTGTGDNGPGLLYPCVDPGDENKQFRLEVTTWPSAGNLFVNEDGTFVFTDAPPGVYTVGFNVFVDGANIGPATATITVGVQAGSSSRTIGLTGVAVGVVRLRGQSAATLALSGTAAAGARLRGQSAGELVMTGSGTMSRRTTGASAGVLDLTAAAAGQIKIGAASAGLLPLDGSATGIVLTPGAASFGLFLVTGSAAGVLHLGGQSASTLVLTGEGTGRAAARAVSSGTLGITGAGTGRVYTPGSGADPAAVWQHVMPNGMTAQQMLTETHAYVLALARIHGLVLGETLRVTPSTRQAGPIEQTISTIGELVEVERVA